ncbi:lysozyme inhibitor LprI family protein [Fulvimarina sp. MAC3]|uniref:lysozyme inhibitor LprI family protein n=1 Tax=Fulvimarina sp. MAC3 TaxID=3148887 RepID=UPI0031FD70DA
MLRLIVALSVASTLFASSAGAETASASNKAKAAIDACLTRFAETDQRECIGAYSDACMKSPDGQTTYGMTDCLTEESDAWDAILNERYQARMTDAKELDKDRAEWDSTTSEAAKTLRAAQRAWVAFRDAECDRIFELNKDGTIRLPETASCLNRLTAERALALAGNENF